MRQQTLLADQPFQSRMGWIKIGLALIAFILLNAIFQYVAIRFGYKRYFINAEILVAVLAFSLRCRSIGLMLFLAAVGLEIMLGLTGVFHFMDVREASDMAEFAFLARTEYLISFVVLIALAIACFWATGRFFGEFRPNQVVLMLSFLGVGLTYSQWSLSEDNGNFFTPVHASRNTLWFGSSAFILKDSLELNRVKQAASGDPDIEYHRIRHPSAANFAIQEIPSSQRILFVISEAWGLPKNSKVLEESIQALRNSPNVKDLEVQGVHARGATAAGELRELCGLIPSRMNLGKMTPELIGECLPQRLKKQGYKTVAVHGAESSMYRRSRWYPLLGFEQMIFKGDMPSADTDCYSFPGYCDKNIFPVVSDQLKQGKVFVYWLTLNSHIPYDRRDIVNYRKGLCGEFSAANEGELLCNYQNLHTQFFEGFAKLIEDEALRGVKVVVVGDHPPIFYDDEARGRFEAEQVPMLHFTVK
ncbi:MAG: sulfatase-like hydrolase/transferase [Hydrogenophaga sp.]|uniref:sulfatase-like hydrolase/transferase n=1 Tax=Hydrogenophaga sp. TaxID=1904254 RepID=UPI0025C505F8|nr:sulfatase-like hydrolase/transferase [Hydrogenophaga sp.]MBT9552422.1 sulfatase-like hydrolase/transferase [Hydrogenophaga sp.]